jgi:hypothetical protein
MAKTFEECPRLVRDMAAPIIEKYHPDIQEYGVTIAYMFATSSTDAPALTHGGHAAAALCRINSDQERAEGLTDCSISICEATWDELDDDEKNALLDHELYHISVTFDKEGQVKLDGNGRPKIRLRKHDIVVGGFHVIVKRHGIAALEAQHVREAARKFRQEEFTFMDEMAGV